MNVTIDWTEPTTRADGKPLLPADILHIEASLAAGTGAFAVIGTIPPGTTKSITKDLTPGPYIIRLAVVDKGGRRSTNVDTSFSVPVPVVIANPSPVTAVKVTVA